MVGGAAQHGRGALMGATTTLRTVRRSYEAVAPENQVLPEPWLAKLIIGGLGLGFLVLFLFIPLVAVFHGALEKGWELFVKSFEDPAGWHAIKLTLIVAAIVVPLNAFFGLAAAWAVTKFDFRGKSFLITLIEHDIKVIFALPGIVLATLFVTFPFVARELIPLMQAQGNDEEHAAATLGAGGWQTFWRVTLPRVKWALLYGIILCNARSMGEFGAVSVVSGHIRGQTNTVPLHIEILYNEYQFTAAFAFAALLALLALVTLAVKTLVERLSHGQFRADAQLVIAAKEP
jgi:sulfate transport system permease protein